MIKSFAGLLEHFVVTFALKEAGYSKETLGFIPFRDYA